MTERFLPTPDAATEPYWTAAAQHRFQMPRCDDCGKFHFYPRALCPHCSSPRLTWAACSGRGTVYSYTIVHRAPSPALADKVPYAVAIVEVEEGPHLMTNIMNVKPEDVRIGMPVRVDYDDLAPETALPVFVPA